MLRPRQKQIQAQALFADEPESPHVSPARLLHDFRIAGAAAQSVARAHAGGHRDITRDALDPIPMLACIVCAVAIFIVPKANKKISKRIMVKS